LIGDATWEKDDTTFALAEAMASEYSYTCAGVIQANNTLGFWIQAILTSFLGSFKFGSDGALQVFLRPASTEYNVQEILHEREALSLKIKQDIASIFNRIIINYSVSYAKIDRRFKEGGESSYFRTADDSTGTDSTSIERYGERTQTFDFDWTRNTATVEQVQSILLDLYNFPESIVEYQGQDFKFMPLELGDQIQGSLSLILNEDGDVIQDIIFDLRAKTQNLDDFTTTLTLQSINLIDVANFDTIYIGASQVYIGENPVGITR
jgi:hypothetical protein